MVEHTVEEKKIRPQYISAQIISTHFDEIARSFSDARAFMAVPVSYYSAS
jgi:hypothetical protein